MISRTIVWKIKFNTTTIPGVANSCTYFRSGTHGTGSGIPIDKFPEYYDSKLNVDIGDLLPYSGSIYIENSYTSKLVLNNINAASLASLAERTTYSVFRSRKTAHPTTKTTYHIVASDRNELVLMLDPARTDYNFKTFSDFKDLMDRDSTLRNLYSMIRAVEITPVDTMVAASTTDNRRQIVKWYIDKI